MPQVLLRLSLQGKDFGCLGKTKRDESMSISVRLLKIESESDQDSYDYGHDDLFLGRFFLEDKISAK